MQRHAWHGLWGTLSFEDKDGQAFREETGRKMKAFGKVWEWCSTGVQQGEADQQQIRGLYTDLMELDPMRKGYYKDALEGKAVVVTKPV
jgi:hypothetical protein